MHKMNGQTLGFRPIGPDPSTDRPPPTTNPCMVPDCKGYAKGKPFCVEHIDLDPHVQEIKAQLDKVNRVRHCYRIEVGKKFRGWRVLDQLTRKCRCETGDTTKVFVACEKCNFRVATTVETIVISMQKCPCCLARLYR